MYAVPALTGKLIVSQFHYKLSLKGMGKNVVENSNYNSISNIASKSKVSYQQRIIIKR